MLGYYKKLLSAVTYANVFFAYPSINRKMILFPTMLGYYKILMRGVTYTNVYFENSV